MTNKSHQEKHTGRNLGIIAGIAAAAAAGAYFLYGTETGKKQKKKIQSWMLKAKGEVLEQLENLKDVSEDKYNEIVASVMDKYRKVKAGDVEEIEKFSKELLGFWKKMKGSAAKVKRAVKTVAPKRTKKKSA